MAIERMLEGMAFDAATVAVMTKAFDDTIEQLRLDRVHPSARTIAHRIIELVIQGERDSARLRDRAILFLRE